MPTGPPGQQPHPGPPGRLGAPSQPDPRAYAGQGPFGPPPVVQTSGKATAVLVLGISSILLMCGYGVGIIPAIVALVLAGQARREIEASGGWVRGADQVRAGVICAWISVGLTGLAVLAVGFTLLVLFLAALPPG